MALIERLRHALAGPVDTAAAGLDAVLAALRDVGLADAEWRAVRDTPAMLAQLRRFANDGGRIERVDADFNGANGMPGLIRFYGPAEPRDLADATFGTLAHELSHALSCPEQWRRPEDFDDAHAYARSRELGEAHAWLNQWRLCQAKVGGQPEMDQWLEIENDLDFGTSLVDVFARIGQRQAQGWSEARILDELALLNANMFPCGMGEGNHKTYGQCNRWDWLVATQDRHPAFTAFLRRLGRPPNAADQKLVAKFNVFTPPPAHAEAQPDPAAIDALADALSRHALHADLGALYTLGQQLAPGFGLGVALARPGGPTQTHALA